MNKLKRQFITYNYIDDGMFLLWKARTDDGEIMMIDASAYQPMAHKWVRICTVFVPPMGKNTDAEIGKQMGRAREMLTLMTKKKGPQNRDPGV